MIGFVEQLFLLTDNSDTPVLLTAQILNYLHGPHENVSEIDPSPVPVDLTNNVIAQLNEVIEVKSNRKS